MARRNNTENLTYGDILESIKDFTKEQLNLTVTVFDGNEGEYHPVKSFRNAIGDDVLDDGHPYFTINL